MLDSHAHLLDQAFKEDLESLLERAQRIGLRKIVAICTQPEEVERGKELIKKHPWIVLAASTTPHDIAIEGEKYFAQMAEYARSSLLVAIGETGLDYHEHRNTAEEQKIFLIKYLELARSCHLPVIIHCRDAFADLFPILDAHYPTTQEGGIVILHCFTGTPQDAEAALTRGWYLSFSGIVTFKKSESLREIAKKVPLNQLLIETDAPYLAPQAHRGQRNEPAYLLETARCLAAVKGLSLEAFLQELRDPFNH